MFPNRIENVKRAQATAAACPHFCYAVGMCGWVYVRCQTHHISHFGFQHKPQKTVVVSHILSTQPARAISSLKKVSKNGFRCVKHHWERKSAAATRLQWTLGGFVLCLITFGIVPRGLRAHRLVIQQGPKKFKIGESLAHCELAVRPKALEVGMGELIRPSVVVPLHVRRCELDPRRVDYDNELH